MTNFTANFNDKLSQLVLDKIEEHPESWNQEIYHYISFCGWGTSHCYIGWCEVLSGNWDGKRQNSVTLETKNAIGLCNENYWEIIDPNNSLAKLKALHGYHVTGVYGINGYDTDGYGRDNLDVNGFDRDGYDIDGLNIDGYNCYGLTEKDIF